MPRRTVALRRRHGRMWPATRTLDSVIVKSVRAAAHAVRGGTVRGCRKRCCHRRQPAKERNSNQRAADTSIQISEEQLPGASLTPVAAGSRKSGEPSCGGRRMSTHSIAQSWPTASIGTATTSRIPSPCHGRSRTNAAMPITDVVSTPTAAPTAIAAPTRRAAAECSIQSLQVPLSKLDEDMLMCLSSPGTLPDTAAPDWQAWAASQDIPPRSIRAA